MSAERANPAVVLLSGGMDSAVTLAIARERGFLCHTLTLDYSQRHRAELNAAERIAQALGVPAGRRVAPVVDLRAIGGSALTASIDVPKSARTSPDADARPLGAEGRIPITYVPARNMLLLSLAVGHAEALMPAASAGSAIHVFIGANAVDYSGYPDCRDGFLRAFEVAAQEGTAVGAAGGTVRVHAPLLRMSKVEIIREGVRLGVDFSLTRSCYDPAAAPDAPPEESSLACGRCDACVIRRRGFRDAGVPDPTRYAPEAPIGDSP